MKIVSPRPVVAILLLAAASSFTPAQAAEPPRPNVVLFLVDDMGWMDCGAYGSRYYQTPNIDAFASRAMRFASAYSQPLCSPTRASILTGLYSARHGITSASGHLPPQPADFQFLPKTASADQPMLLPVSKNYLEPSYYTLAEALHDAGYRTGHIGKWHLGTTSPHWPEAQGFDTAFHCHPDPGPPGEYFSPYGVSAEGGAGAQYRVGTITDGPKGEYIVDRQAAEAETFIAENRARPFYLNLWCYGVHGPWGHKPQYTKAFQNKTDSRGRQRNPIMASMLRSVDECFGRVLAALDAHGLRENTIVIFYSDNGGNTHSNMPGDRKIAAAQAAKAEFLADWRRWAGDEPPTNNAPLRDGKGTLYEGGTRVPLMWSWPGRIRAGAVNDTVVGHVDVYPTLLELLGLSRRPEQTFDGRSYAPLLLSEAELAPRPLFLYHPHAGNGRAGGVAVRLGDWKLLRWFGFAVDDPARYDLYDLRQDIGEQNNRASAEPARVAELDRLIDGFLAETGALYPRPNPAYAPATAKAAKPLRPAGPDDGTGPLAGWKLRGLRLEPVEGGVRAIATAKGKSFVGTAKHHFRGPGSVKLRTRSASGGPAEIHWRLADEETFAVDHSKKFELPSGTDWRETTVELGARGQVVQLRLFLPLAEGPIDINSIEAR